MSTVTNRAIALDVLLQPDEAMISRVRALNARLRAGYPEGFALDARRLPHVTLVQCYVAPDRLAGALEAVAQVLRRASLPTSLLAIGYNLRPSTGIATISIHVERTPVLDELQAALVEALAPFTTPAGDESAFARDADDPPVEPTMIEYVRTFVPQRTGDGFEPHITVGKASETDARSLRAESFAPQRFGVDGAAICQLGIAGTARRKLWPGE